MIGVEISSVSALVEFRAHPQTDPIIVSFSLNIDSGWSLHGLDSYASQEGVGFSYNANGGSVLSNLTETNLELSGVLNTFAPNESSAGPINTELTVWATVNNNVDGRYRTDMFVAETFQFALFDTSVQLVRKDPCV